MIRLILPGSIRSKKNSKRVFKKGKFTVVLPSKAYLEWEKEARESVVFQDLAQKVNILTGPIHVEVHIYYKGSRPDLSGAMESVGDCLEGIAWANDRQIESWAGSRLIHDLKNPRTEVFIHELSVV